MKQFCLLCIALGVSILTFAQEKKVYWSYLAKKVKDRTYEIRVIASIEPGWYIYAQSQPPKSVSQATEFSFTKSPIINFKGTPQEEGTMVRKNFKVLGIESNTYLETVTFLQLVVLKADVKTNLEGTVKYQTCNDNMCLPPETNKFSIMLQ